MADWELQYEAARDLTGVPYDSDLYEGAHSAVFTCLKVKRGERVVLITDLPSLPIGAALYEQFKAAGAAVAAFVLEDLTARPMVEFPPVIAGALETASVSCFTANAQVGELRARIAMTAIVNAHRIRHAHMVNITPRIMREGMRADFVKVDALSRWVLERVVKARSLTATTPAGTSLTATFSPEIKWLKTSGIITPEKWANLPGGEVLTAPIRVDGVFVVDGVMGDWLAPKYGNMQHHPLTVVIEDSRIADVRCKREEIVADFKSYTSADPNSNRVGELALGTNLAVTDVIGQILQDEKIPGLHIAFGHPYSEHTGAPWKSSTHIDLVGRCFDVSLDGEPIMKCSRFLVDYDSLAS
ncbi:MAG TPA: aminopeptidase [Candidatus Polarisedimenticolia bacterium]|nr:aminopeptidase [Candidatus Polarisedimenticolia bacterium]